MTPNLSIFAIPAFWLLVMIPHSYAVNTIKASNNGRWNNSNSKSLNWEEEVRKSVPAEVYARYTRSEAAHRNGLENLPLFIGSVILGNMAKLDVVTLNTFAASYLLLRTLYTVLYVKTTTNKKSYYRSLVWAVSVLSAIGVICRAGYVLA